MIKILAIGNSFSQDATYYLHQIAKAAGMEIEVVNLYIGGCSLERHFRNIEKGTEDYLYEQNGIPTERYVSIKDALEEKDWDYVITQQASHDSGWLDTYEPFLEKIIAYIKNIVPKATVMLHKTWAYEIDSEHESFPRYNRDQIEMYERLSRAYEAMAEKEKVGLIPCADVIQKLRSTMPFVYRDGGMSLCRDGYHMHYIYGRYALAAAWFDVLTGGYIKDNPYVPSTSFMPEESPDMQALEVIKQVVDSVCHPV